MGKEEQYFHCSEKDLMMKIRLCLFLTKDEALLLQGKNVKIVTWNGCT